MLMVSYEIGVGRLSCSHRVIRESCGEISAIYVAEVVKSRGCRRGRFLNPLAVKAASTGASIREAGK